MGPVVAYRLIKERQPKCSLNLLWALAAALRDIDWRDLDAASRAALLRQVNEE